MAGLVLLSVQVRGTRGCRDYCSCDDEHKMLVAQDGLGARVTYVQATEVAQTPSFSNISI
jgi:hypothetical protein